MAWALGLSPGTVLVVFLWLLAAFVAGLLLAGGAPLWFALLVGLTVFGGEPGDPLAAVIATVAAFFVAIVVREEIARRRRRS